MKVNIRTHRAHIVGGKILMMIS